MLLSVARRRASEKLELTRAEEKELGELVPAFYEGSVTVDERPTLDEMVDEYELSWLGREEGKDPVIAPEEGSAEGKADPSTGGEPPVDDRADARKGQQSLDQ